MSITRCHLRKHFLVFASNLLLKKFVVNNPLVTPSITFKISQLLAHLPCSDFFPKRKSPSLFSVWHVETPACP